MITIFDDFYQFVAEKMGCFLENQRYYVYST
jgi:hypothetical protein